MFYPNFDLSSNGRCICAKQREITVRGSAGYDFHVSLFLQALECPKQVLVITIDECLAYLQETLVVHEGQDIKLRL